MCIRDRLGSVSFQIPHSREVETQYLAVSYTHLNAQENAFAGTEEELLEGWKAALLAADYKGTMTGILHTRNDNVAAVSYTHLAGYVRLAYCVSHETVKNALTAFEKLAEDYGLYTE